ncbi:MAG: hypothetical protein WC849_00205 [Candidatus Paceibacterota bacterium]
MNADKKSQIHPVKSCEAGILPKAKLFNRVNADAIFNNIFYFKKHFLIRAN